MPGLRPTHPNTELRRRGGTSAVELALTLPVLMLLVLGCVDFGRVLYSSIALKNAVGAATDYAATHRFTDYTKDAWESRVETRATEEMEGLANFNPDDLNLQIETVEMPDGRVRATVTATYPFQSAVDWPGLPNSLLLRHRLSSWQYR